MSEDLNTNQLQELSKEELEDVERLVEKNPYKIAEVLEQKIQYEELFLGPIPHPNILNGYKNIDSTFPDRIFKLTEKDQEHRIKLEGYAIKENLKLNKWGMVCGFLIAIFSLGIGAFLLYNDKSIGGFAALLTPLVGVIAVFISNKKTNN